MPNRETASSRPWSAPPSVVDSSALLVEGPWVHRFVPANGARFHVALAGPDDRDAPLVVLLHGLPEFWWAWRHQLVSFAAAGYRVAAMDVRGTGASDKPPQGYDVPTLARDVAGVIRSLGSDRAVVVGQGLGGEIAWAMPAFAPDVTRAIAPLSAPHPLHARSEPLSGLRPRAVGRAAYFQLPLLPERSLIRSDLVVKLLREWGARGWTTLEIEETYRRAVRVPFAAHSAMEQARWLARSGPRMDGQRYAAALRSAPDVPVLQLHGGLDGCRGASSAAATGRLLERLGDGYRFELLPTVGHFLGEEAPERVDALLLPWLAKVTAPGA